MGFTTACLVNPIQIRREYCMSHKVRIRFSGHVYHYFEVSVNINVENRREKFIILISILYPFYSILIRSQNVLCFLRELLLSFLSTV